MDRYLVGNPCHEFPGYRDYIIVVLPQLKQLDGADVTRTEKLQARQKFAEVEQMVMIAEKAYLSN
jgi:protein TilB